MRKGCKVIGEDLCDACIIQGGGEGRSRKRGVGEGVGGEGEEER